MALPPCLIGLPYDASSTFLRGAAAAPPHIRAALQSAAGNSWTEGLQDLSAPGALEDLGDLALDLPPAEVRSIIEQAIGALLRRARPIALGGDHSITYPVLRAVQHRWSRPTILHLDAHPDLYDSFGGDRFTHASPFARVLEEGLAGRLVQVGIRAMTGPQQEQARRFGVEVLDLRAWSRGARPDTAGPVYLSIDLDVLDPAFAPGVSHREPGGLTVREVLTLVQECRGTVIGADIVEYNPTQDSSGRTATVAAKLVKEVAGRMLAD